MEVGGGETVESVLARLDQKSEYALVRATCVGILFISLWALNLHVFKVAHIDISCIYPLKLIGDPGGGTTGGGSSSSSSSSSSSTSSTSSSGSSRISPVQLQQPLCHPRKVVAFVTALVAAMGVCTLLMSELLGQPYQHAPFVFYFLLLVGLAYPFDYTRPFRELIVLFCRILWLVFFPGTEVHFLEVLVGDILTSLSKVFFEMGLAAVATFLLLTPGLFQYISADIIPTLLATTPFILRIRQCSVQYRGATSEKARLPIALNILKYCSSIPGLWLPLILARHYSTRQIEKVLLWVLLGNSLYSFMWDVVMDWGLGHVSGPSSKRHWGLRPTLLFGSAGSYYSAIALDLCLRLVWVLKYVRFDNRLSYDKFMLLIEVLEVVRRGVWSIYRIEWEVLSLRGGGGGRGKGERERGGGIGMIGLGSERKGKIMEMEDIESSGSRGKGDSDDERENDGDEVSLLH